MFARMKVSAARTLRVESEMYRGIMKMENEHEETIFSDACAVASRQDRQMDQAHHCPLSAGACARRGFVCGVFTFAGVEHDRNR